MARQALIAAGLALGLVFGVADAEEVKGKIKEINASEAWLTLEDGIRFIVVEGVGVTDLEVGDEVTVSYDVKDGRHVAIDVSTNKAE